MISTTSQRRLAARLTAGMRTALRLVRVPGVMFMIIAATVGFVGFLPEVAHRFAKLYIETEDHCRFYDGAFLDVNSVRNHGGTKKLSQISTNLPVGREIPLSPPFSKGGGSGPGYF